MPKGARVFKGERLRKVRKSLGLTQSDFDDIGIQQSQITKYERNEEEPSPDTIVKLARKLNTTADYLLGLSTNPNNALSDNDLTDDEKEFKRSAENLSKKK